MSTVMASFRFMSLPPEMQIEIAKWLPLKDVKNLSLACKAVRERMLAVLFASLDPAVSAFFRDLERVPFPLDGYQHVRVVTLRIWGTSLEPDASSINRLKSSVESQLGLLKLLPNLAKVKIDMSMVGNLAGEGAAVGEGPASYYQSTIKAVCSLPSGPALALRVETMAGSVPDNILVLTTMLELLQDARLAELRLGRFEANLSDRVKGVDTNDCLSQVFYRLAPKLRVLHLDVPHWLARRSDPPSMPMLEKLKLNYQLEEPTPLQILSNMSGLINACGDRLSCLELSATRTMSSRQDMSTAGIVQFAAVPLKRTLHRLRYDVLAFPLVGPALTGLSAAHLYVRIHSEADWHLLTRMLREEPQFRESQHLCIDMSGRGPMGEHLFEAGPPQYSAVKALIPPEIATTLRFSEYFFDTRPEALFQYLPDWASDIVELHLHMSSGPFDLLQTCRTSRTIILPRCTSITISLTEDVLDPLPGFASRNLDLLTQLLRAPWVETINLDLHSIFSDCLQSLTRAIVAGYFPSLRQIEGLVLLSCGRDSTSPLERLHDLRWKVLCSICKERNIALSDLTFDQTPEEEEEEEEEEELDDEDEDWDEVGDEE